MEKGRSLSALWSFNRHKIAAELRKFHVECSRRISPQCLDRDCRNAGHGCTEFPAGSRASEQQHANNPLYYIHVTRGVGIGLPPKCAAWNVHTLHIEESWGWGLEICFECVVKRGGGGWRVRKTRVTRGVIHVSRVPASRIAQVRLQSCAGCVFRVVFVCHLVN